MRITNKIIQNNSISNINGNKVMEDMLNTQLSTGKKVNRPSDDPVVALRALRLRTNLSEVTQYFEKNIPDATSWLSVTEASIDSVTSAIKNMYSDCTSGSAGFKTAEDRTKILENMKGLRDEIYAVGNADYAGRHVFTGYRTDMALTFDKATKKEYTITEQLDANALSSVTFVQTKNLEHITSAAAATDTTVEQDIYSKEISRIRLAYNNCMDTVPEISYYEADGTQKNINVTVMSANGTTNPYEAALTATDAIFIPETGELLLPESVKNIVEGLKNVDGNVDANGNDINEGKLNITYKKQSWNKNDLRPEHYFYCETPADNAAGKLVYNEGYLTDQIDDDTKQIITYDVGFNQEVRVNTNASDIFTHDIGRDLEEMINNVQAVIDMETTVENLKSLASKAASDADKEHYNGLLDAANKSLTFLKDKMQKSFEQGITKTQGYLDRTNEALTEVGNRAARVDLVKNRLSNQQTNFKTLSSENEDADVTEVAIQLSSVELSYQAALMATGKISQTTLLNYI